MKREIEQYSDIQDCDCVFYTGKQLKELYSRRTGCCQLAFESVKNNKRDCRIYKPYNDFEDEKIYKCFEYSRIAGSGIEYDTISIMNY